MKGLKYLNYFAFIFFNFVILLISYIQVYNLSLFLTIIYYFILIILLFLYDIIKNGQDFKSNIYFYFITYMMFLICLTLFLGRSGFGLITKEYFAYYIKTINLIPFKTILGYIFSINDIKNFVYNILGNLVALIPFSILLLLKNKKYISIKKQFIMLSIISLIIELLQLLFCVGRFDIDDYILNVFGSLLFVLIISKSKIYKKKTNVLNIIYNINVKIKLLIYFCIYIIMFAFSIYLLIGLYNNNTNNKNINNEKIYVIDKDKCENVEIYEYNDYILNFDCVDVLFETFDNYQLDIKTALNDGYLTIDKFKELLKEDNFVYDENLFKYRDITNNTNVYICKNKIYFVTSNNEHFNSCKENN